MNNDEFSQKIIQKELNWQEKINMLESKHAHFFEKSQKSLLSWILEAIRTAPNLKEKSIFTRWIYTSTQDLFKPLYEPFPILPVKALFTKKQRVLNSHYNLAENTLLVQQSSVFQNVIKNFFKGTGLFRIFKFFYEYF
jgi:hypothetical protein